jgi:hypothetical protein
MHPSPQRLARNPRWWTDAHHRAWERVRDSLKREWETNERRSELHQDVDSATEHTLGETRYASGEPRNVEIDRAAEIPDDDFEPATWEQIEPALRYGAGARQQYPEYPVWTEDLEAHLRRDWREANTAVPWDKVKAQVRRGWETARRVSS